MLPGWRLFPLILPSRLCRPSEFSCGASFAWERLFPPAALDFPPGFFVCVQIFNRSIPCSILLSPVLSCAPCFPLLPLLPSALPLPVPPSISIISLSSSLLLPTLSTLYLPLSVPPFPALSRPPRFPLCTSRTASCPPFAAAREAFLPQGRKREGHKGRRGRKRTESAEKVNFIPLGQGVWSSFYHFF